MTVEDDEAGVPFTHEEICHYSNNSFALSLHIEKSPLPPYAVQGGRLYYAALAFVGSAAAAVLCSILNILLTPQKEKQQKLPIFSFLLQNKEKWYTLLYLCQDGAAHVKHRLQSCTARYTAPARLASATPNNPSHTGSATAV